MNKKKILIVDDNDVIREIYAEVFRKNGFEVLTANDGVEGADIAISEDDLSAIFTGVVMPRMDGFQMLEILKKNPVLAEIPAFINSHLGREEDRKKAEEMGLQGFFVRGTVSPAEVCQKIKEKIFSKKEQSYLLKINPWELDGELFIENNGFPLDLKCENCGSELVLEIKARGGKIFGGRMKCPNCGKKY